MPRSRARGRSGPRRRGEARERDHPAPRAQEQEGGLEADLHPRAGDEGDPPAQVDRRGAVGEVLVAAGRAELVVERVEAPVLGLAHVALARLVELGTHGVRRVGRRSRPAVGGPAASATTPTRPPRAAAAPAAARGTPARRGACESRCPPGARRRAPCARRARRGRAPCGAGVAAGRPAGRAPRRSAGATRASPRRRRRGRPGPRRRGRGSPAPAPARRGRRGRERPPARPVGSASSSSGPWW